MAYWFHRNPLKATATVNFDLHGVSSSEDTRKILTGLRMDRSKLLDMLVDPNHSTEIVDQLSNDYISMLEGLYLQIGQLESENKLRKIIGFKWTDTLTASKAVVSHDACFEHACITLNVALWYTKHAAKLAAKDEPDMEDSKVVHKCLRTAAGMFMYIKESLVPRLIDSFDAVSDTDRRILDAYVKQCTAEAQEVTIARAIELKHSSGLVAALANETATLYSDADSALSSLDEKVVMKWRKYFQLKHHFYLACAHSYNGETLLAQDKCGDAIRSLQESFHMYERAEQMSREYASAKGVGTSARPQNHLFFRKLGPIVKRTLEKCERENGMIYHQKVPIDVPQLELKATYGLVSPEEYNGCTMSPLWTVDVYDKFNCITSDRVDTKTASKTTALPEVKEKETPMSDKDPKNFSGCSLS